ncbi:hypothetical protein PQX77_017208 [Marasmius sp. AFHP31]|nr:hypothetical protein PQX77_017208 [Marasmius sp. AFHP31]
MPTPTLREGLPVVWDLVPKAQWTWFIHYTSLKIFPLGRTFNFTLIGQGTGFDPLETVLYLTRGKTLAFRGSLAMRGLPAAGLV